MTNYLLPVGKEYKNFISHSHGIILCLSIGMVSLFLSEFIPFGSVAIAFFIGIIVGNLTKPGEFFQNMISSLPINTAGDDRRKFAKTFQFKNNLKKAIPTLSFFIIVLLHLSFLLAIFYEKFTNPLAVILVIAVTFLITIAYMNSPKSKSNYHMENPFVILFVIFGAIATHYLNINLKLGPVISVGLLGTLVSFAPLLNKRSEFLKLVPTTVYCGYFVGMSASYVATDIRFIILAGFLTGVIFVFSQKIFNGFGGKLGTIAFGGVVFTLTLQKIPYIF
ncbi:hypothetical protein QUF90_21805 [Desulfococcaceae bacterium HSG9]|nr:hypothetical protein [Desulfococcaceae bacterium HSG9]